MHKITKLKIMLTSNPQKTNLLPDIDLNEV